MQQIKAELESNNTDGGTVSMRAPAEELQCKPPS